MMFLMASGPLFASAESDGQPGAFLRRGVGSRALAMGNAYTSVANDASALYWNPAGLPQIKRAELLGMYSVLSFDRLQMFVSFANNFSDVIALGVGWLKFGVTDIDGRDALGNATENFEDSENSFMLSIGKRFGVVSFGVTGKYLNHSLAGKSATGFGFDVGASVKLFNMFNLGVVAQDVAGRLKWNTDSGLKEALPISIRAGASFRSGFFPIILSVDASKVGTADIVYRAGGEYRVFEFFGVSAGYDGNNVSLGGLARLPGEGLDTEVDYAATRDILQNDFVHHITLRLGF
jgi:hypothetical protein